jgi:hypothetical protein
LGYNEGSQQSARAYKKETTEEEKVRLKEWNMNEVGDVWGKLDMRREWFWLWTTPVHYYYGYGLAELGKQFGSDFYSLCLLSACYYPLACKTFLSVKSFLSLLCPPVDNGEAFIYYYGLM